MSELCLSPSLAQQLHELNIGIVRRRLLFFQQALLVHSTRTHASSNRERCWARVNRGSASSRACSWVSTGDCFDTLLLRHVNVLTRLTQMWERCSIKKYICLRSGGGRRALKGFRPRQLKIHTHKHSHLRTSRKSMSASAEYVWKWFF